MNDATGSSPGTPPRRWPEVSPFSAGLRCRCPRCGQGRLFQGLLTVRSKCEICDLDLSPHEHGDGPAVFVILLLGALVVPLAFWFETAFQPPMWGHLVLWTPTVLVASILMLRPMKATMVAMHFKNLRHEYDE
jgi:uncharacterized protein (DUF983 family)